MKELTYVRADTPQAAVDLVATTAGAQFLGGGTNLVDHLKLGVATPDVIVDISRLPMDHIEEYHDESGPGLRIGANVSNSDFAAHAAVRASLPGVARALLAGASGQIRNQATTGGNLLQRTRCAYFQDVTTPCNKREPGTGCSALDGYGRHSAILGASEDCVATHPSDLAVALAALEARVVVLGPTGERRIAFEDLHRLPGDDPTVDTTIEHGELITSVEIPTSAVAANSNYRKVRDRASFAFALVSVASALEMDGAVVRDVRIAWGGVAHKPWRARRAEESLRGSELTEQAIRAAVSEELSAASTNDQTTYKVPMLTNTTALALLRLAEDVR